LNIFYSDLTKKLKIKSNKYNNILLFNVLEHLPEYRIALSQINRILKKNNNKVAIELNGEIADKKKYNKIFLKKNDKIEIVQFIGGG